MKKSSSSKEILAIFFGILLIAGTIFLTIFRNDTQKATKKTVSVSDEATEIIKFFNGVSYIQADILQQESLEASTLILDLRDPSLFGISHIPGSLTTNPNTAVSLFQKQLPRPEKITLIDDSGQTPNLKSTIENLRNAGIKNIFVLAGGYSAWNTLVYQNVSWGDPDSIIDHSKVHAISVENTKKILHDKEVVFVDLRKKEAFDKDHKPDSVNIPFDAIETLVKTLPQTKMLLVYGENPLESFQGGVKLFDLGYLLAYTLNGGYADLK